MASSQDSGVGITILLSSLNHIQITTKLQNNHHLESPKVRWIRFYNKGYTTEKWGDWKEGADPTPTCQIKIRRIAWLQRTP